MLKIVDLHRSEELSSHSMVEVVGGIYMNFGDIKGESTDDKHKDWIEVLSADAKPAVSDITITKYIDKSSSPLFI